MDDEFVSEEVLEAMGISRKALDEVVAILGRGPKVEELSTLLAMWQSNGRRQSLIGWLRGQRHTMPPRADYLYTGNDSDHVELREPRIRECYAIAHSLYGNMLAPCAESSVVHGELLYMVGNVSTAFMGSEYASRYLHLASQQLELDGDEESAQYHQMILDALLSAGLIGGIKPITQGGLFVSLLRYCAPSGFDILTCREVRLDAFLFGEEKGRFIVSLVEAADEQFLQKLDEAKVNCCLLGHATRGRVLVDGYDFGNAAEFFAC